jgi:hypothetical protein
MTYQKNIQISYHQQDTDYYCGAACAQMILDSIGAGILDQDTLYNENHSHTSYDQNLYNSLGQKIEWATPPDGLNWTLNHHLPTAFHSFFVEDSISNEDSISRMIAWTIEHFGVPPAALVLEARHWILVRGMTVSTEPQSSIDTIYTISQFRINDPWPPVPSWDMMTRTRDSSLAPPPPHSQNDNCGTGGNRGIADELVAYSYWQTHYMTAANYHPNGHWQGKFVAVCDPDRPPERRGPFLRPELRFDGNRILSNETAVKLAREILDDRKIFPKDERWSKMLSNIQPMEPIFVQRIDRLDDYYYIVPLSSSEQKATGALLFDARYGTFQQATSFPTAEETLVRPLSISNVHKLLNGAKLELGEYQGVLPIREEALEVLKYWCWKPCRESLSPLWPFRVGVCGGQSVYVRIDGKVFTELHDQICGL